MCRKHPRNQIETIHHDPSEKSKKKHSDTWPPKLSCSFVILFLLYRFIQYETFLFSHERLGPISYFVHMIDIFLPKATRVTRCPCFDFLFAFKRRTKTRAETLSLSFILSFFLLSLFLTWSASIPTCNFSLLSLSLSISAFSLSFCFLSFSLFPKTVCPQRQSF